jgi:hypothetical protein
VSVEQAEKQIAEALAAIERVKRLLEQLGNATPGCP